MQEEAVALRTFGDEVERLYKMVQAGEEGAFLRLGKEITSRD